MTGAEVSLTLIVCTQLVNKLLLLVTVADHVLVMIVAPVQPPAGVDTTSVKLMAGVPHDGSPATAVANPVNEGVVLLPRHKSTFAGQVITGGVLQIQVTVTLKAKVATLPQSSTAV
jgi:hypothetical protein